MGCGSGGGQGCQLYSIMLSPSLPYSSRRPNLNKGFILRWDDFDLDEKGPHKRLLGCIFLLKNNLIMRRNADNHGRRRLWFDYPAVCRAQPVHSSTVLSSKLKICLLLFMPGRIPKDLSRAIIRTKKTTRIIVILLARMQSIEVAYAALYYPSSVYRAATAIQYHYHRLDILTLRFVDAHFLKRISWWCWLLFLLLYLLYKTER